ncbi:MAG: hypothetical protein RMN25_13655, partial [Anaerolineae bacterium]|nr:esterase family protein [Thermoflexales bacterium]MDW8408818.1 hypothetical protein [Anaerolineae bacterium]
MKLSQSISSSTSIDRCATGQLAHVRAQVARSLRSPVIVLLTGLLILDVVYVLLHSPSPASSNVIGQGEPMPVRIDTSAERATAHAFLSPLAPPPMVPTAPSPALLGAADIERVLAEPTPIACGSLSGRLVTETIASKVLGVNLPVHVYLPPCYDGKRYAYPVIYLMRGTDGYGNWVRNGLPEVADLHIGLGLLPPFVAVMPATDESAVNGGKFRYSSRGSNSWE